MPLQRCRYHIAVPVGLALLAGCGGGTDAPQLDCLLPSEHLYFGGVSRDGIPALTNSDVVGAGSASFFVRDFDRVLGIVVNGAARAYPFSVIWWHEIANDTLGGEPVVVTYCPLTGSGIAFDPTVDGEVRNFGVSGLLFENNLVMFDRRTNSLWNQMFHQARCGPATGSELARIPVVETTWLRWSELHPNSTVLTARTGFTDRNYGTYPYGNYDIPNNFQLLFPSSAFSAERAPKELVLGILNGSTATAYPFGVLSAMGDAVAINDMVGDLPVLVTYLTLRATAMAFDRRVNGQLLTFSVDDPTTLTLTDAETGSTWSATGEAIAGPLLGEKLAQIADAYVVFWFAWSIYHANTEIFR